MRSQNRPIDDELLSIHEHRGQMRSYGDSTYPSRRPGGKHGRCEAIEREAHTIVIPFGSPPVIHHVVSDAYGVLRGLKNQSTLYAISTSGLVVRSRDAWSCEYLSAV